MRRPPRRDNLRRRQWSPVRASRRRRRPDASSPRTASRSRHEFDPRQGRRRHRSRQRHRQGNRPRAGPRRRRDRDRRSEPGRGPGGRRRDRRQRRTTRSAWRWTSPSEAAVNAGIERVVAELRRHRHPGVQRRHPDRQPDRELRLRRLEEDARDPPGRRLPDHQGSAAAHVQGQRFGPEPGRHRDLHGVGAFARGLAAEVGLRHRQARPARPVARAGEGRRRARRAQPRGLPGLRAHAAGRQADSRAGQGARHQRRRGDQEGDARRHRRRRVHHGRGRRPDRALPVRRVPERGPDRAERSWSATAGTCSKGAAKAAWAGCFFSSRGSRDWPPSLRRRSNPSSRP